MCKTTRHTNYSFIEKAKLIHGNKYDYSLVDYKNNKTKVKIICENSHIFEMMPNSHLSGQNCGYCKINNKMYTNDFIEKAKLIHGNKYDYSLVNYKETKIKVKIICKLHGIFEQVPYGHLVGQGCPYCSNKIILLDELIEEFKEIHNNKYDYSLVKYSGSLQEIKIICPMHGLFLQKAVYHKKHGCSKCGKVYRKNTNDFILEANLIHNNMYTYEKSIYINCKAKLIINCKKHGEFSQSPNSHLNGRGCPVCKESTGEKIIRNYLQKNKIIYKPQYKINNFPFDFYLSEYNLMIEYDGIQHFQPVSIFGGEEGYHKRVLIDATKNNLCLQLGISLLRIPYYEKNKISEIIENKIKKVTNLN